jgi:hypothetical protein
VIEWIKLSDRLPKVGKIVLVCSEDKEVLSTDKLYELNVIKKECQCVCNQYYWEESAEEFHHYFYWAELNAPK